MSLKYEEVYEFNFKVKLYHRHGEAHRANNPAIIWKDGDMGWAAYGDYHRMDGPAKVTTLNRHSYYIRGTSYTREQY